MALAQSLAQSTGFADVCCVSADDMVQAPSPRNPAHADRALHPLWPLLEAERVSEGVWKQVKAYYQLMFTSP